MMIRYALINIEGNCRVYNIEACALMYQKIFGGVIKEINVGFE